MAATAISLCFASIAKAETVGILDVTATGVPDAAIERFEAAVEDGMRGAGFTVEPRSAIRSALARSSWVEGCTFGPCLRAVREATGINKVLVVRAQAIGSTYTFIASLIDTGTGMLASQVSQTCAACSVEDAALSASMLGSDMLLAQGDADADGDDRSRVRTSGVPSAAETRRKNLRVAAWVGLGASVVAGAAGAYFLVDDRDDLAAPVLAGAGAGLVGTVTMFAFSRRF